MAECLIHWWEWLPASLWFQVIYVDGQQIFLGCSSLYPTLLIKNLLRGQSCHRLQKFVLESSPDGWWPLPP